jgi:two-component sensor histidine kinase
MALIHEKLYSSDSLVDINFPDYMRTLSLFLLRSYQVRTRDIELSVEIEEISLGIDFAVPCGIILNELLSNCFKYAFPDDYSGAKKVTVRLSVKPRNWIEFVIADNGVGLPEGMETPGATSLGLELVKILAEGQLDGTIDISRAGGTRFTIVFPWKK